MNAAAAMIRAGVVAVVLLGALGLVTWRQSRAFEALAELDRVRQRISLARAERVELERTIQVLESRARVVPEARDVLGMHTPDANSELIILAGDPTP